MMKKIKIFLLTALATISISACNSQNSETNKDAKGGRSAQDSVPLDSFGADGTAKSKIGTSEDSTIMGTPPEKKK